MSPRRLLAVFSLALALFALAELPARRLARAADLLVHLSGGAAESLPLVERDVTVPGRHGPIAARVYRRQDTPRGRGLVVAHGVHYQGIDERRLVPFARALARSGLVVMTPELRDLADYRITPDTVDTLVDATLAFQERGERSQPKVGLLGFSFAGGLSLVAASRPELAQRLEFVVSVGGHHDLSRVSRFLLTNHNETPDGMRITEAHEYGLMVLVYGRLEQFVPAADLSTMRRAFRAWLHDDKARARAIAAARTTPEAEQLFDLVERGRLAELSPQLTRLLAAQAHELAALSPRGRLRQLDAPVYLLHGAGDSVIPPSEARWAEQELAGRPHAALVSPLLTHVEVDGTSQLSQKLELVAFMARLL